MLIGMQDIRIVLEQELGNRRDQALPIRAMDEQDPSMLMWQRVLSYDYSACCSPVIAARRAAISCAR